MKIVVIIPAFNEERAIGKVIADLPADLRHAVVVVDNNSTDATARVAMEAGATVVREMEKGYGAACLAGIEHASSLSPDAVIFLDADYSDYPGEAVRLIGKLNDGYDMVIGSRVLGHAEAGALLPQARWGNLLAVILIRLFYGQRYTDLGPFRAIRWDRLLDLKMADRNFGWTVEMQVKAAKLNLKVTEVPVSYRKRIGASKVTGTISGTIRAGYKILWVIFTSLFD
jgi:glycosyltransferase involved in cell wall biosynthesis